MNRLPPTNCSTISKPKHRSTEKRRASITTETLLNTDRITTSTTTNTTSRRGNSGGRDRRTERMLQLERAPRHHAPRDGPASKHNQISPKTHRSGTKPGETTTENSGKRILTDRIKELLGFLVEKTPTKTHENRPKPRTNWGKSGEGSAESRAGTYGVGLDWGFGVFRGETMSAGGVVEGKEGEEIGTRRRRKGGDWGLVKLLGARNVLLGET